MTNFVRIALTAVVAVFAVRLNLVRHPNNCCMTADCSFGFAFETIVVTVGNSVVALAAAAVVVVAIFVMKIKENEIRKSIFCCLFDVFEFIPVP